VSPYYYDDDYYSRGGASGPTQTVSRSIILKSIGLSTQQLTMVRVKKYAAGGKYNWHAKCFKTIISDRAKIMAIFMSGYFLQKMVQIVQEFLVLKSLAKIIGEHYNKSLAL